MVATDRLYSEEHAWVKTVGDNLVVIGISTSLVETIYEPYILSLPQVGDALTYDNILGSITGYKMSSDLISPVSGTVVQINKFLTDPVGRGAYILPLVDDPYNSGWMLVVKLSKPDELKTLLTAQSYKELVAK